MSPARPHWHVHGSYLINLTQAPVTWLLPVRADRSVGYGGRGATVRWGDIEVEVEVEVDGERELDVDLVLTQHRRDW